MVPRDSSRGCGARFGLVYEPGGCWAGRGGIERCANHWRLARKITQPSLPSTPIAKSDVPGEVVVKAGNTPNRWRIHRNKSTGLHLALDSRCRSRNCGRPRGRFAHSRSYLRRNRREKSTSSRFWRPLQSWVHMGRSDDCVLVETLVRCNFALQYSRCGERILDPIEAFPAGYLLDRPARLVLNEASRSIFYVWIWSSDT